MERNYYEQLMTTAADMFRMSAEMATSEAEMQELHSRDKCWVEGFAAGLHEGGLITDEQLDNAPKVFNQIASHKANEVLS